MARRSALTYAAVGAIIAEAIVWAVVLPWAHYRYTTGIAVGFGLWKPILMLALVGGSIGLVVLAAKRAVGGRSRPLADICWLTDAAAMRVLTRGQLYGIVLTLALIGYFIAPPAVELAGTPCSLWSFAPNGCEVGVRGIFRGAVIYCALAGYLLSRILDREPLVSSQTAPIVAASAVILFGLPLWLGLHAAFW